MAHAFDVVRQFEAELAKFAGSKNAVTVNSCTNALFLSLMYHSVKGEEITIPKRTYPSVPCSIINAGAKVAFEDLDWQGIYYLKPYPIIDAAKRFTKGMYIPGTFMCISFHIKKILDIGTGGAILTDDRNAVKWLKQARFDGRHEVPLPEDSFDMIGWNMYMEPEQAARGLWRMGSIPEDNPDQIEEPPYPDLSQFKVYTEANR